ncbi:MAG: outer membrane lipoprotein-sorting protein [Pseudomonadales bacterium]
MLNRLLATTLLLATPLVNAIESQIPEGSSPESKGLAIAQEADRRDTGWVDQISDLKMILRNKQGQESTREIRTSTLEITGDGDKSLSIFDTPADVRGTAFLSHTHALKSDDQWLFLPALKRVKRISSSNKSGPYMGSEFAYEDISSQEVGKYTYKWLHDEALNGRDCFVMERYPLDKNSGYTRQVAWMDKTIYQPLKVDYYDRKDSLLKTQTFNDYQLYLDKFWRPDNMEMINHQTGKSTVLLMKNFRFGNGFKARNFNKKALQNAR